MAPKRKLNEHDVPSTSSALTTKPTPPTATPKPTFAALALDPRLLQALNAQKFAAPTPVQAKTIPLALASTDVLARAKTGSGKTLAYLLPILQDILKRNDSGPTRKETVALILVPTKELAAQVTGVVKLFTHFCGGAIGCENLSRKEDAAVTRARLVEGPDIVVATPGKASQWTNDGEVSWGLQALRYLVIDEADLVLSYGYEDDLKNLAALVKAGVRKIMMSATLRTEVDTLTALFFPAGSPQPTTLDLSKEEALEKPTLAQYVVRTSEDDKFLLIYTLLKLQLLKGKIIIFVADVDRCYRVKLFLEQFGIRSCVLNSELPVRSRLHVVEEFNRGVVEVMVVGDEGELVGGGLGGGGGKRRKTEVDEVDEEEEEDTTQAAAEVDDEPTPAANESTTPAPASSPTPTSPAPPPSAATAAAAKPPRRPRRRRAGPDREYGVARGIDFRHVTCVLNFDLPTSAKSYTHRIGRTARAGQTGMALSFHVPKAEYRKSRSTSIKSCANDDTVLGEIKAGQEGKGAKVQDWAFDMAKIEGFRYRLADALRAVTRIAVREARTRELRHELVNSAKLARHFEENPEELAHLVRHDGEVGHGVRRQEHLRHVPDYLLPAGGKGGLGGGKGCECWGEGAEVRWVWGIGEGGIGAGEGACKVLFWGGESGGFFRMGLVGFF
ncbi:hypothetical protein LTR08_005035 [Meristemomyces frigidus]|nr:hypothetical protein LTR08_005035 [Meristemomyces frigidus]